MHLNSDVRCGCHQYLKMKIAQLTRFTRLVSEAEELFERSDGIDSKLNYRLR